MAVTYELGAYLPCKWRLDGAGSDTTLKILKSDFTESGTVLVKKMSGDGAIPQRFAGFLDAEFNVTMLVDSTLLPTATAPGFKFGAKGTIRFPVHTTTLAADNWFSAHVMVTKVNYVNTSDDLLEYNINVAVDASAVAQGGSTAFTYPT